MSNDLSMETEGTVPNESPERSKDQHYSCFTSRTDELEHVWYAIVNGMATLLSLAQPWVKNLICTWNNMA